MKYNDPWSYCPSIELNIFQPIFGEWLKKAFTFLLPQSPKPAPKYEAIDSQLMEFLVDSLVDCLLESFKESLKESFMGSFMESLFERCLPYFPCQLGSGASPSLVCFKVAHLSSSLPDHHHQLSTLNHLPHSIRDPTEDDRGCGGKGNQRPADSGEEANCANDTGHNRGYNGRFSEASAKSTSAEDYVNRQSSIVNKSRDSHKAQRHCHKRRVILIGGKQRHDWKAAIRARDLLRDQSPESRQGPAQVNRYIREHREWWSERTHDRSPSEKTGGTDPPGRLTQDEKNEIITWYEDLFKEEEEEEDEEGEKEDEEDKEDEDEEDENEDEDNENAE